MVRESLKILVGANVPPDPNAGASGTVWQMNEALRRRGHQVEEIWSDSIGRRIQHGNLHYLLELPLAYRREVRKAFLRGTYDVVELNQPHACAAARDHLKCRRTGVFVNRSHGHETRSEEQLEIWRRKSGQHLKSGLRAFASKMIQRLLDRQWYDLAKTADGFIVSCSEDAQFLQTRYNIEPPRIGCITQGVPQAFLDTPPAPMTANRLQKILYVGQLAFFKAPDVLAQSINQILNQNAAATMTWVCGALQHATAISLLDERIRSRVEMVHWMNQIELQSILDTHGVFIFPSYFEGFGKAPLEAMSRGLCVIATKVGGMKDYIVHEQNGFHVEPGRHDQIAAIAIDLMKDAMQATQISGAARNTAEAHTWDRCAADAESFYLSLLKRKHATV